MEKKEDQLREAAKADAITNYSGTKESEYVMAVSENTYIRAIKSDFAKQYHYSNDSVDVDELEDAIENIILDKTEATGDDLVSGTLNAARAIIKLIKPRLQKQQESDAWISVEDRLPNKREVVIIYWIHEGKERITSGSYNHSGKYWQHSNATQMKVTHWQPLPDKPKDK